MSNFLKTDEGEVEIKGMYPITDPSKILLMSSVASPMPNLSGLLDVIIQTKNDNLYHCKIESTRYVIKEEINIKSTGITEYNDYIIKSEFGKILSIKRK